MSGHDWPKCLGRAASALEALHFASHCGPLARGHLVTSVDNAVKGKSPCWPLLRVQAGSRSDANGTDCVAKEGRS
jgi:hypothetical protein